jgi:hypothetical protein
LQTLKPTSTLPTQQEKQWLATWKLASPKLEKIRDEELRQKSNKGFRLACGVTVYEANPHRNGMVTMQAWFMRLKLLDR